MPTAPEFGRALCLVRAVEILRQAETHEKGNANSNVRVTREVGVNLERISEKRNEVFKACEQERGIENAVHKVCRKVVAQDNLLGETVQNPEHGHAKSAAGEEIRLVELRNELVGTNDWACHELREERKVKAEVQNVIDSLDFAAVNVDAVAHRLECEERNAHREDNRIDERMRVEHCVTCGCKEVVNVQFNAGKVVKRIQEEVRVFVIAENEQVNDDHDDHQHFLFPFFCRLFNPLANEEVCDDAEDEDANVTAARLVVEEQAGRKEERVA